MAYNFDLIIKNIFFDIIKKEKLDVILVDDQVVVFQSYSRSDFVEFVMSRDGVDILYVIPKDEKTEIKYNIGEYISNKILPRDRLNINLHYVTFFDRIVIELKILNNVFNRLNGFIFPSDNYWFEDYKKSPYYVEPRIIEK